MTTLLRVLIDATGLSRRRAFAAIREGLVTVGGSLTTDPSAEYTSGPITLEGIRLREDRPRRDVYLLLNKPPGYVTSRSDELGRPTVYDLVPAELRATGLHSVGRLDRDTSGLLILTNDGKLTQRLTHPSHEVAKEYWAGLTQPLTDVQLQALADGVELDGRLRRPLAIERLTDTPGFELAITIAEGRKRQVRRMFEAVDARVVRLRRAREGPLALGLLPEGSVRKLTRAEVSALYDA
jgi:23S rRNA pseudouridine2605 synthase